MALVESQKPTVLVSLHLLESLSPLPQAGDQDRQRQEELKRSLKHSSKAKGCLYLQMQGLYEELVTVAILFSVVA